MLSLRLLPRSLRRICLACCATLPLAFTASASPASTPAIDRSIVLEIGPAQISHYAVEKNFKRAFGEHALDRNPPAPDAAARWFETYLARQVAIAEALAAGYGEHPQAVAVVTTMERHMLSQTEGPFYRAMYPADPPSEARLRELHARTALVPHVVAARLPAESAHRLRAQGWADASTEHKLQRLRVAANSSSAVVFHDGPLPWPHGQFPELEPDLAAPAADAWIEKTDALTSTFAYVRSIDRRAIPPFEQAPASFDEFVQQFDRRAIAEKHRRTVLSNARFTPRLVPLERVAALLQKLPPAEPEISDRIIAALADEVLATYVDDSRTVEITATDWRSHHNRQFLRRIPRTAAMLASALEDMVMTEFDLREARRQGIDQAPQFVEDRRNFLYYQALDWFEKERIAPSIQIDDAEIEQYYRANLQRFSQPQLARGHLLRFPTETEARAWLAAHPPPYVGPLAFPDADASLEREISRERPLPGFADATEVILRLPDSRPLGPTLKNGQWHVFVKRSTVASPQPLAQVAESIRRTLLHQRIEQREIALAPEWAAKHAIRDAIDYTRFGITRPIAKPWSK